MLSRLSVTILHRTLLAIYYMGFPKYPKEILRFAIHEQVAIQIGNERLLVEWVSFTIFSFLFKIFVPESWPCMAGLVFGWLIPLEGIWTMYDRFLHLQVAVIDVNKIINSTTSTASFYLCNLSLPLSNKQCHLRSSRILLEGSVVLLHTHHGIQPRTWYQANYRNL